MVLGRIDRPWDLVQGHPKCKRWSILIRCYPLVQPTPAKSASRLGDRDLPHLANRRCLGRFQVPTLLEAEIFPDMPEHDPGWRPFQAARFSIELAMLGQ